MIILSNNSKEKVMKLEKKFIDKSWSTTTRVSMSLDFGSHIAYSDYDTLLNENVFYNVAPEFGGDDIIDDLRCLSDLSKVVYVYKLDETNFDIQHVSLYELLNSDNDDEFTTGCFLAARMLYLDSEQNYSLDKEIALENGTIIHNIDEDSLGKIILEKDKIGRASFIGSILIDDSENLLYKNSLKLDQTGEFAYSYIQQDCALNEVAQAKIIEKDTDGFFTIELLNYTNGSPMPLAEKIVSINNPLKIVDFINRYDDYLESVKADGRIDTGFVKSEKTVKDYLNNALIELDYANINMKQLIEDVIYKYETDLSKALFQILDLVIENSGEDLLKSVLEAFKNQFNDDFIEAKESLNSGSIKEVKHYKIGPDTIYTVLTTSSKIFVKEQTTSEFLKTSEKMFLTSLNSKKS